jgi:phosphate-selective porin OprO/OprP
LVGHARAGHFFEPFSLERVTQNHRNTFMERSLADAFAPARNLGIEAYDALGEEERASYRVGWYAANSDNFGDQFTDTGGQALTARGTWLPIWYDEGRVFMHVGAGYSYRTPPNNQLSFATTPEARSGAPTPSDIPDFVNTGNISADHNQLLGAEWALVYGPLYIQSEYIAVPVDQLGGPSLFFDGAYVNVSYFLTGESRTYNKLFGIVDRVFPYENFFRVRSDEGPIVHGKGAWEIAARYSFIDLDDANIQGGRLHNYTLGLNWYLNAYTRMKWELIQSNLDRAPVGESQAYIAGMRFDIDF